MHGLGMPQQGRISDEHNARVSTKPQQHGNKNKTQTSHLRPTGMFRRTGESIEKHCTDK